MVIKTEPCSFSEYRVYPGHGMRFVRRDGTLLILSSSKCKSLLMQRKKPAKLTWTQSWRRLNKKMRVEEVARRRTRKSTKLQRAIVGASLDEIRAQRKAVPKKPSAAQAAALKEIKDRKKAAGAKAKAEGVRAQPQATRSQGAQKNLRGGSKR